MKRRTLKLVVCAAITALTLSVTACGGTDDAKTTDTTEVEDTVETEDEAEPEVEEEPEAEPEDEAEDEAESVSTGEYTTLEDYYNDPTVKSLLDGMYSNMEAEGLSLSLDVKGNEFAVIIQIEDSSMVVDGLAEALEAGMDEQADQLKEQVKQFDEVIGEEGACTVTMRYTDPDGNVIAERSVKAD